MRIGSPVPWGRLLRRGGRVLLDTVLPRLCPGCEIELSLSRWICTRCRRGFRPAPRGWICWLCRAKHRPQGDRKAGYGCRRPEHAGWWGRAAFWMEPPLDTVIHALKYEGRRDLAVPLGRLLATRVAVIPGANLVTVPLHRVRYRERGYNQAHELARFASSRWGTPLVDQLLIRRRATKPQARLPGACRAGNVEGAFGLREPTWVRGKTWLLLDDVATTGSTLCAAAVVLRDAGAGRVVPVSLALA